MKTPMQELIYKWESEKGSYIPNGPIFQEFINDAQAMLEKEKEVIMDAYNNGQQIPPFEYAEKYYNDKYGSDE